MPAMTNETQTAEPATSPAAPSREKIPAPTMAPTPMKAAWRMERDTAGDATAGCSEVMATGYRGPSRQDITRTGRVGRVTSLLTYSHIDI